MLEIQVDKVIAVDPKEVWEALVDHEHLDTWMSFNKVVRIRPGWPDANGVGAVRKLQTGLRSMEERITHFEPGKRLDYEVVRGAPGWDTRGRVCLSRSPGGGTLVWWKVSLHPYLSMTAPLIRGSLRRALDASLERLRQRLEPQLLLALAEPRPVLVPTLKAMRAAQGRARAAKETSREL